MTTQNKCSRDDCKPQYIRPELTTSCADCRCEIHLPCIGIQLKVAQIASPNVRIFCNDCVSKLSNAAPNTTPKTTPKTTQKKTPNITSKSTPKKNDIETIANEMRELKKLIVKNGDKLNAIDGKASVLLEKVTSERSLVSIDSSTIPTTIPLPQISPFCGFTPRSAKQVRKPVNKPQELQKMPNFSYADAARQNDFQMSAKRKRTDIMNAEKFAPKAKSGTKLNSCGLSVVSKPKRDEKPKFDKAIWVSRFNRDTTVEEITDYILTETNIDDKSMYTVHKLVKKDCDLTTLKFVSFKIQVNEDNFAILMDPDMWPEGILVREFVTNHTLGDHLFPSLNAKNQSKSPEAMEINVETAQNQPATKSNSPNIDLTSPKSSKAQA